jgi:hypothetical protein
MRVIVAVLGDLGRSPRMLYHALALADSEADVELVGYRESELPADVARHPHIRVWPLRAEESIRAGGVGFVVRGVLRVVRQGAELLRLLLRRVPAPDVLLVQNPPAVPSLAIALTRPTRTSASPTPCARCSPATSASPARWRSTTVPPRASRRSRPTSARRCVPGSRRSTAFPSVVARWRWS